MGSDFGCSLVPPPTPVIVMFRSCKRNLGDLYVLDFFHIFAPPSSPEGISVKE